MPRYFLEVFYKGTNYSGFQIQRNANTVQAEIEKSLNIFFKQVFSLTGSSRTDAGVHAISNYFHFDWKPTTLINTDNLKKIIYNLNSILPQDLVIQKIFQVEDDAHCRFDAISRQYKYYIYQQKNPFYADRAFYYPYKLDINKLNEAATSLIAYHDFTSFSKHNTQVNNFNCNILKSEWVFEQDLLVYNVISNRFLRGMVKGLVGTMLKAGTGKIAISQFCKIIESKDCGNANFAVPPHGLFLVNVQF